METLIKIKELSYEYSGIKALEGIDLNIIEGENLAIIGPNGSGKSTLLKIIGGVIHPDRGDFYFRDTKITEQKLKDSHFSKSFYKSIGFVFQNSDTQLFCPSVYEEIAFGPVQMGMSNDLIEQRVKDCLELLGIDHLKDRAPYNLSEGEKKKVAIACVLSTNPDLLILDEPFNGLDMKTKKFLKDFIVKINQAGKTVICATHDFAYIKGIFKKVAVLSDNNKIVFVGDYEKIIANENFLTSIGLN
ncbi:MAG: ABC transporter ATP-binding protein [bacterium]